MKFKNKDYENLAILLNKGYSFIDSLKLLNLYNISIEEEIVKGKSIELLIIESCNGKFKRLLKFFLNISSLEDAIISSLKIIEFEKDLKNKLLKKCTYPIFIFIFAFFTVYIFSDFIIPQLLTNFESGDTSLYNIVLIIKNIAIILIGFFISFIILIIIYNLSYRFKIVVINNLLAKVSVLKMIITYKFAGYLMELSKRGLSTKESILFLLTLNNNSSVYYLTLIISRQLESGNSLDQIINSSKLLSNDFKTSFNLGSSSNLLINSLESYIEMTQLKFIKYINFSSIIIQFISYSFVAVLIICVYQIMLIPLQMLDSM